MSIVAVIAVLIALGLAAGSAVVLSRARAAAVKTGEEARTRAAQTVEDAKREAEGLKKQRLLEAREQISTERTKADAELQEKRAALHEEELQVERALNALEQKESDAAAREEAILRAEADADESRRAAAAANAEAERALARQTQRLEEIAGLTRDEARAELTARIETDVRRELAGFIKRATEEAQEEADKNARTLVAQAIHRTSARPVVQGTMTTVKLPNDEIKGRIIGREGRNIRSLENALGVDVIIDDTPNTLLLSSWDPLRREIARISIERLIEDGRVHPARIEEVAVKVQEEFDTATSEAGEAACLELGLAEVHPRLQRLLGRLKFRTQHGYNLLDHSLEVAFLAGYMSAELGGRPDVARRAGLLHEVAQTEDVPPPTPAVLASSELVAKFGESDDVAHAIRAIHRSVEPRSIEALVLAAAERIALNRPGARKNNLEIFIERLSRMEEIATSFPGVKRAYAVRAGKELRVMVEAEHVTDDGVTSLSRDIASRIERELDYPGQVRIQVIREIRAIDFAV